MPEVSVNLDLINRAERVLRDDEGEYDLVEYRAVIDHLVAALLGRETQLALLTALVADSNEEKPTEHYRNQYRVTYPRTRSAAEPRDTRVFEKSEEMLDLALYCKQSAPDFADHVVMEHRALFAGPWKRL